MGSIAASDDAQRGNSDDAEYNAYLKRVRDRFTTNVGAGRPVFTTDAGDLWALYLDSFADPVERQHHDCHACRHFIQRFGSLVTIDEDGRTAPAIWNEDDAPEALHPTMATLARAVRKAKVTGVFLSSDAVWGTPKTGAWHHLSVAPPRSMIFRDLVLTPGQKMAEKREDFGTVARALDEFTAPMIDQAVTLLQTDSLYRSEKVLGAAEWLQKLHAARSGRKGNARANVLWLAVATAPAGFCHPRSSMIGTLLEDIAAGLPFEDASRKFAAKMHPLAYQRPQAAPSAGTIAQAEKIVAKLQAEGSLARRFARLDDIEALWKPREAQERAPTGGVFGHLKAKGIEPAPTMRVPAQVMTWEKFARTVLPTAERVDVFAPARGNYTAFVTTTDPAAPPILQWDREDARNPVSLYVWNGGSPASQWGLVGGTYHKVSAITLRPHMWRGGGFEHQGKGVAFLIEGARETRTNGGLALFPETLRNEFHGIRSVIEAHSRSGVLEGREDGSACGLLFDGRVGCEPVSLRVWSGGRSLDYRLDRWD